MNPTSVPTHHLHISTGLLIVAGLIFLATLALIVWVIKGRAKPKPDAGLGFSPHPTPVQPSPRSTFAPPPTRPAPPPPMRASPYRSAPQSYREAYGTRPSNEVSASSAGGMSAGTGFLAGLAGGVLLEGALRDDQSYTPPPAYDPPAPSQSSDGGFTYESGPSVSDSGSSDNSSGGFDLSW